LFTDDAALEGTGIIYTATIKNAAAVQEYLTQHLGVPAAVYHSKLPSKTARSFRNRSMTSRFGPSWRPTRSLGIGQTHIRFVVHFDLPGSLEAYTQEAGRAGRDGLPSRCILISV